MQLQAIREKITAQISQHSINYQMIRHSIGNDTGLDIGNVDKDNNPQPWRGVSPIATAEEAMAPAKHHVTPARWSDVSGQSLPDSVIRRRSISEPLSDEELAETQLKAVRGVVGKPIFSAAALLSEEQRAMVERGEAYVSLVVDPADDLRNKLEKGEAMMTPSGNVIETPHISLEPRSVTIVEDPLELFAEQHKRLADLGHAIDFDSGWGSPRKGYKQLTQSKRGTVGLKVSTNTTGALLAIRTEHDGDGRVTTTVMFERNGGVELAGRNGIEVVQDVETIMDFFNTALHQK